MKHRKIIPYNPKLKQLARNLRNNSSKSEIILWMRLKGKQMKGYDFHRQKPLDNYIADFFCHELMLAIEIDGYSHLLDEVQIKDAKKEKRLNELGIRVLRFLIVMFLMIWKMC
jgi:very-short-patch-repair endonuclease